MKIIDFHTLLDTNALEEPLTPIPLNGGELEHLISPISCEEFVNSYFAQTSMNIEGQPK
jgi:hypothetical protein